MARLTAARANRTDTVVRCHEGPYRAVEPSRLPPGAAVCRHSQGRSANPASYLRLRSFLGAEGRQFESGRPDQAEARASSATAPRCFSDDRGEGRMGPLWGPLSGAEIGGRQVLFLTRQHMCVGAHRG